jgi:hypothetical protein
MTYAILHLHLEKWSELHKYVVINILEWCTRNALNNAAVALFYSCSHVFNKFLQSKIFKWKLWKRKYAQWDNLR